MEVYGVGSAETLTTTGNHPFYDVETGRFIPARELCPGSRLVTLTGESAEVDSVELKTAPPGEHFTTYNLEVEEDHTYHVGTAGVWVHNISPDECIEIAALAAEGNEASLSKLKRVFKKNPGLREQVDRNLRQVFEHHGDLLKRIDETPSVAVPNTFKPLLEGFDFGKHLRGLIGDPPKGMIDPHAHHILFKKGLGPAQKALVEEGQAILRKVGIDPIYGKENLVWAPFRISQQHGAKSLKEVVDELQQLDRMGGDYNDFVEALTILGQKAANRGQ